MNKGLEVPLRSAGEESDANLWRSIESAPKDGTSILAWAVPCEDLGYGHAVPVIAFWVETIFDAGRNPYWHFEGEQNGSITHWVPIPKAPS